MHTEEENEAQVYTVYSDYLATGEGVTYMALITRGYGQGKTRAENAMNRFREIFGDYMAQGATVKPGLHLEFPGSKVLISDAMREKINDWNDNAGGLEWHSSLHLNFS